MGREVSRGTGQAGARDSATGACRRLYLGGGRGENREICQWGSPWEPGSPHCVIHAARPLSSLVLGLSFAALQERRLESRKRCLLTRSASLGRVQKRLPVRFSAPRGAAGARGPHWQPEAVLPSFLCGYSQGFLFHCVAEVSPVAS